MIHILNIPNCLYKASLGKSVDEQTLSQSNSVKFKQDPDMMDETSKLQLLSQHDYVTLYAMNVHDDVTYYFRVLPLT